MSVSNEIENITAEEAKKKLNDPNVQFIDVRDKDSFSNGTIGNTIGFNSKNIFVFDENGKRIKA